VGWRIHKDEWYTQVQNRYRIGSSAICVPLRLRAECKCLTVLPKSRGSSVSIVTMLRAGRSGFDSKQGLGIFLFATQPPIQWIRGVKRPRREADHSPSSTDVAKNVWNYTSNPIRLHSVVLRKAQGQLHLTKKTWVWCILNPSHYWSKGVEDKYR
jgi:hypothetical protein